MTLFEMQSLVDLHINETNQIKVGESAFPPTLTLHWLNRSQDRLIGDLYYRNARNLLPELDGAVLTQSLGSSGEFDLALLTDTIFANYQAIDMVKISGTYGKPCRRISYAQHRELEKSSSTFSTESPVYYQRGTNIYVQPYTTDPDIDIYYMREPLTMDGNVATDGIVVGTTYYVRTAPNTTTFTVTYNSVDYTDGDTFTGVTEQASYTVKTGGGFVEIHCELSTILQDVIIDLAVAEGFFFGNDLRRATVIRNNARERIDELVVQFPASDGVRYGEFIYGDTFWSKYPLVGRYAGDSIYNC